jgi:hypothetical protein
MIAKKRYLIIFAFFFSLPPIFGQGLSVSDTLAIPPAYQPEFKRLRNHDLINAEQKAILDADGKADKWFTPSGKDEVDYLITQAITKKVDNMQYMIETDTSLDHRLKVLYLSGLENLLKYFRENWQSKTEKKVNPLHLSLIINAYEECMNKDEKNESIEGIIDALPYDAGVNVLEADIFESNPGYERAKDNLVLKYCTMHPDKTFATLLKYPDVPFADSLVKVRAKVYTKQLYNYAQANNKLGFMIRKINDDPFIQAVVKMARSRDGQQYFCFLDNIVNGKITYEDIDKAKDDSLLYYRLLVKTQIDYVHRALNKDTAFEFASLSERLGKKAREGFVNIINGLHNEPAAVRFRTIQPLTPEELYYLAVFSDGSIYTSSFVKGVYPLMMQKVNNRGDSLLLLVGFDRYRKFIKMAAGYNTLGNFLSSFPKATLPGEEDYSVTLMRAFVKNLEKSDSYEDAVDVADSYASIAESLKPLADEMIRNVEINYQRNFEENNKKGVAIYKILKYLFLSADTSNAIDLAKELGIPPVYEVPYTALKNADDTVFMQVFFYGDKDGQAIFRGFLNMFSNSNWKIDQSNRQWVTVNAVKGKPVTIFANRPLPEETGEDEEAQVALCSYIEKNKYFPSITIHRGHSYYADATISHMFPSSRIVFLGSCGGYHLIHDVLKKSPDAHIIASKQIGATVVNRPFFQLLTDKVRMGNNIDWIPFWKELDSIVVAKEFEDYIPPYKNLGALFIKAYKIAMGENDDEELKAF